MSRAAKQVGWEMDEAVHEQVMGYRRTPGGFLWLPPDYDEKNPSYNTGPFNYSRNLHDAWSVVEEIEGRRYQDSPLIEAWDRIIRSGNGAWTWFLLTEKHAAEAICRAALQAVHDATPQALREVPTDA